MDCEAENRCCCVTPLSRRPSRWPWLRLLPHPKETVSGGPGRRWCPPIQPRFLLQIMEISSTSHFEVLVSIFGLKKGPERKQASGVETGVRTWNRCPEQRQASRLEAGVRSSNKRTNYQDNKVIFNNSLCAFRIGSDLVLLFTNEDVVAGGSSRYEYSITTQCISW